MDQAELTPDELREALKDPVFRKAVRDDMWYAGELSGQLRRHGQKRFYDFCEGLQGEGAEPVVGETHRRFGKSHYALMLGAARCIRYPGQRVVYAAPTKEQAAAIVPPNLSKVLETCPADLRPVQKKWTHTFKNPRWPEDSTPSVMEVFGINSNPDAARGGGCDMAIIDEAGYVDRLEYFINEVLGWQFLGRFDPFLLLISTPPRTMDHPFITKYIPRARASGRHFFCPASKNEDFTEADERMVERIVGSKKTVAWRREAECEHVTDPDALIVPEWQEEKEGLVQEFFPPDFYLPEVCGDVGWSDHTSILYGWVNFEESTLDVYDEIWTHYQTVGELAEKMIAKEKALFGDSPYYSKIQRRADAPALVLESLGRDHKIRVQAALKHDRDATIAGLRTRIQRRQIRIHPRCEQLIYQLDNGIWNEKRTDWERSGSLGHCDAIAALGYMCRTARWRDNPIPPPPKERERFYQGKRRSRSEHPVVWAFKKDT